MKRRAASRWICAGLLATLPAALTCDTDPADPPLPLAGYCAEWLRVFCETRTACYSAAAMDFLGHPTVAECEAGFADGLGHVAAPAGGGIAAREDLVPDALGHHVRLAAQL